MDGTFGELEDEEDTSTLLTELLGDAEDEEGTSMLFTELPDPAGEGELDTGALLTGLLVMDAAPDVVGGERADETADDGAEEPAAAELEEDVLGMGSARAGATMASPQARTAMELLRRVCMVIGGRLCCNEGNTPVWGGDSVQMRV